jgi:beta-glucanase (GH16 family)
MEFLSKQFRPSAGSVNLVLQTPDSVRAGYDASGTPAYAVPLLPFAPDAQFHEYRFDWSPDKISFYADGHWLADMTVFSPNAPGHLVLNHWSNGDAAWSAGPPESDAVMTIAYIKAYFNSSDPARQAEYAARCASPNARSVCQIPDQRTPPDPAGPQGNQTAKTYFFSQDPGHVPLGADGNATKGKTGGAVVLCEDGWSVAFVAALPFLATLLLNLVMTV